MIFRKPVAQKIHESCESDCIEVIILCNIMTQNMYRFCFKVSQSKAPPPSVVGNNRKSSKKKSPTKKKRRKVTGTITKKPSDPSDDEEEDSEGPVKN